MSRDDFAFAGIDGLGGLSRSEVLLKGMLAAGAAYGAIMVGPFVREALAESEGGDIDVLNFALGLEQVKAGFYTVAFGSVHGSSRLAGLIGLLRDGENQHVEVLTALIERLGGEPVQPPQLDFELSAPAEFLRLAQSLEETTVGAYNGAAAAIESKEVLAKVGALAQIEARHAAAVRIQAREKPAPSALDPLFEEDQVLEEIESFTS